MLKRLLHIITIFILLAGLLATPLAAQQGNPFELKHRQQQASSADSSAANPFELQREGSPTPSPEASPPAEEQGNPFELSTKKEEISSPAAAGNPFDIKKAKPQIPVEKATSTATSSKVPQLSSSFLFWVIMSMLIFMTLSVSMYKSFIVRSYRAFTNENFLKLIHRDQGSIVKVPYLILYVGFFFNTSVFVYLIARYFELIAEDSFGLLFQLFLLVTAIFLAKHIVLKIIGSTFPVNKEIKLYSFTIVIFSIIIGLLLVPLNTLIAYAPAGMTRILVFGALFATGLVYLFRTFRSLFIASRFITLQKFHFFMYLCTVEIAPLLILVKVISLTTGIQ